VYVYFKTTFKLTLFRTTHCGWETNYYYAATRCK